MLFIISFDLYHFDNKQMCFLNSVGVSLYHEALCGQLLCRVVSLVVRQLNIIFVK